MNDALRFRVWDKLFNHYWSEQEIIDKVDCLYDINNVEIEKYIGINDNKGKRIYEGDIIKTRHGNGFVYRRDDDCFAIRIDRDGICPFDISVSEFLQIIEFFEIIGNIHENPELLK